MHLLPPSSLSEQSRQDVLQLPMRAPTPHSDRRPTYVRGEDFNPSRLLFSPCVFEAERHALLVRVPSLHLIPLKGYYLVLKRQSVRAWLALRRTAASYWLRSNDTERDPMGTNCKRGDSKLDTRKTLSTARARSLGRRNLPPPLGIRSTNSSLAFPLELHPETSAGLPPLTKGFNSLDRSSRPSLHIFRLCDSRL